MSTASNVALAIFIPILLVGAAFFLGIIEISPQNSSAFLQSIVNAKNEVIDIVQGKSTVEQSIHKVQTTVEETAQKSSSTFDNVIRYAQKKADPSNFNEEKPEFNAREIEFLVHELTNKQREAHGLSKLSFDDEVANIARDHSLDMTQREFFSHETPEGLGPSDRADKAGYSCTKLVGIMVYAGLAENIFQGFLYDSYFTVNGVITSYDWLNNESIAEITVDGWMNSAGHRKNILTEMFDREGIGVIITEDDKVFVTQNFC